MNFRNGIVVLTLVAMLMACAAAARAQSLWEVSPYSVEVWLVVDPSLGLNPQVSVDLAEGIERSAENRLGAVWTVTANVAPQSVRGELLREAPLEIERLKQQHPELEATDKLFVVRLERLAAGYQLTVHEVDLVLRLTSSSIERIVTSLGEVVEHALQLMCDVFVPIVRIDRIDDATVIALERAGELMRPEDSQRRWQVPTRILAGDVLQPVLLRTNRSGKVGADGVKAIDWTLLIVDSREGSLLTCRFESGYRQPFSTRRSSRISQLAYRVRPRNEFTTLRIVNRRDVDQPLVGYQVYGRPPGEDSSTDLVGRTNWRGEVDVSVSDDGPVRILFVRNGQQLLGKLPIVPGYQPLLIAPLRDDELRLEAEGFLLGVQDSLVDLVARREVLAARIRRAIEARDLDQADLLLKELRQLDTQDDFARRVQQRKQQLSSLDTQVQQKIDELFAQTRSLLGKYLSQEQVDRLARAITEARQNPKPAEDAVAQPEVDGA